MIWIDVELTIVLSGHIGSMKLFFTYGKRTVFVCGIDKVVNKAVYQRIITGSVGRAADGGWTLEGF